MIVNGGFGTNLNSWTTAGTVNRRLATNTINTSGGNAGFNSFFTTPFAALGDASGVVGDTPGAGISSLSQTFTLPGTITEGAVDSYDLVINFSTVFDGRDDGDTPLGADLFSATLDGIALFSQVSTGFPDGSPSASSLNNQLVNNPFGATILGLAPGSYTLTFILNESNASDTTTGGVTNTAAGIDAVSVLATANLVQLPEPGSLALAGAALALSGILTRRGRRETSRGTR
jgi:hypothetical protein